MSGMPERLPENLRDGTSVVRAGLPGVDPGKDVEITVDDGLMSLRGERAEQTTEKHRTAFRQAPPRVCPGFPPEPRAARRPPSQGAVC
ncbi:hypothetical protein [Streptomyces sp. NPDC004135]